MSLAALRYEVGNLISFGPRMVLRNLLRKDARGAVSVNTRHGVWTIRPRNSDLRVLRQIFRRQDYDLTKFKQHERLLGRYDEAIAKGATPVIIDAGANIGAASAWFAQKFPRAKIVSVEPDPGNAQLCRANTAHLENVEVVEAAIGAEAGSVSLVSEDGQGWGIQTRLSDTGTVAVVTVRDLLSRFQQPIELLLVKIDIEGFEAELFAANTDWVQQTFAVVVELHDYQLPGRYSSMTLQRALCQGDFEMVISGENLIFIR